MYKKYKYKISDGNGGIISGMTPPFKSIELAIADIEKEGHELYELLSISVVENTYTQKEVLCIINDCFDFYDRAHRIEAKKYANDRMNKSKKKYKKF